MFTFTLVNQLVKNFHIGYVYTVAQLIFKINLYIVSFLLHSLYFIFLRRKITLNLNMIFLEK
jgi:hypothetical protein